jgi:hypothetical protein
MPSLASVLVAAASFVIFCLGSAHLLFTFRGNKLHPRDPALMVRMREISPVISREMSMWNAWVSFNATHSFGAMLFGLIYGYLSLAEPAVLFSSWFLLAVGLALLGGCVLVGWRYWFSTPFRGVVLSTALYIAGLASSLSHGA